jgi:hypothetical protein
MASAVGRLAVVALIGTALAVSIGVTPATADAIDPPQPLADWGKPATAQAWYPAADGMAFDPDGDLWTLETWYEGGYQNYVVERDPASGAVLRKWTWDYLHGSFLQVDPAGNIWTFVPAKGEFSKYSPSGALLATGTLASVVPDLFLDNGTHPRGYAIDGDGNLWTLGGTLEYETRVYRHNLSGQVTGSWPRPGNSEHLAIGPDGDVYLTSSHFDEESGELAFVVARHHADGTPVGEVEIGGQSSYEDPWDGVRTVNGLAIDPDGTIVVAGPVQDGGNQIDDTLLSAYSPAGELLTRWGPTGLDENDSNFGARPATLAVDRASGTIAVMGEADHFWTFAEGDSCALPQESGQPELGGGGAPPAVGDWLFAGCWTKVSNTRWEATGQINANGLLVTPDTGGKVVLDTGAGTLAVEGQARVETGAFSVAGRNFASILLHHGGFSWGLNAATLPLPLQAGLRFLGFGTDAAAATMTPGPDAGGLVIGPINVAFPDLIGGTGQLSLRLRPGGIQPTSWRIGPTARLLGGIVPVENLFLQANDKGWGTAGDVVLPGANGVTLGGAIEYDNNGQLTGAAVRVGNVSLFGGVLPVKNLTFFWTQALGWGASAKAPVPGQSDSNVTVGLSYGNGAITSGQFEATRVSLGGVAFLENFALNYNAAQQKWSGNAQVRLGDTTVTGAFVMEAGQFTSGNVDLDNANLPLAPGVSLRKLAGGFSSNPWSINGTVGIGAGPVIENKPAVTIQGGGSYTYGSPIQPARFHVDAIVALTDFQLLSGSLDQWADGRVDFDGHLGSGGGFNFAGVSLSADLTGWAAHGAYSAQGAAAIGVNGLNLTGQTVVSSTGLAACGGVKAGWTWQTGLAYRWVGNQLTVLAGSCDLRPWTTAPSRPTEAEGGPAATFVVPADEPVHGVELTGTTAPPLVTLEGPNGESYVSDTGIHDDHVVTQDADERTTTFLIDTPSPGTWEVHLQPGSSPLAGLATAEGLDDPEVAATVTGSGATRHLAWALTPQPGQVVTFVEQGPETSQVLTTTSAATGGLDFTPAAGAAGTRDIVALVEQDGVPRAEIVAGSYEAPGGVTVTVERTGTGGTVTSSPVGIRCGTTCAATFDPGTEVTLTATPDVGTTFAGWGGACEGTEACTVTATTATMVTAEFSAPNQAPTAPSITGPTAAFRASNAFTVSWGGATDGDGAVASHDVRYRRAGLNGAFAAPVTWQTASAASSAPFTGVAGSTYCFSARATDDEGAVSAWSAERCTTTPLDDRGLTATGGFVRRSQAGNLANTFSDATRTGAALTRNGVKARQVAVVVQRCRGCGTVRVRLGTRTLGTINLSATATRKKQIVTFNLPQARTGNLVVTVTSSRKPVRIDGIAALP